MKKFQIPISNSQIPACRQAGIPNSNEQNSNQFRAFGFGILVLFDIWGLEFGISVGPKLFFGY